MQAVLLLVKIHLIGARKCWKYVFIVLRKTGQPLPNITFSPSSVLGNKPKCLICVIFGENPAAQRSPNEKNIEKFGTYNIYIPVYLYIYIHLYIPMTLCLYIHIYICLHFCTISVKHPWPSGRSNSIPQSSERKETPSTEPNHQFCRSEHVSFNGVICIRCISICFQNKKTVMFLYIMEKTDYKVINLSLSLSKKNFDSNDNPCFAPAWSLMASCGSQLSRVWKVMAHCLTITRQSPPT